MRRKGSTYPGGNGIRFRAGCWRGKMRLSIEVRKGEGEGGYEKEGKDRP